MSNTSHFIAHQVDRAESLDDLKEAAGRLPLFVRSLYDRGVKPRYIAPLVTDLNRKIMARVVEEHASEAFLADACLMVMLRGLEAVTLGQQPVVDVARGTEPGEALAGPGATTENTGSI
jgi:hypothetical protein